MSRAPLRLFIGYDEREAVAYHTLAHSILSRASVPISITPLVQSSLRQRGAYWRERGPTESTSFSLTRFLVPYLSDYEGFSVFMDSDMLCRVDVAELYVEILKQFQELPVEAVTLLPGENILDFAERRKAPVEPRREKAVLVCQHDYTPKEQTKFLGNIQTAYPKKNWSSFMVFANDQCKALTPEYVNTASGLDLHRLNWLAEGMVGSLPLEWNYLVGVYGYASNAKIAHFTDGGPYFPGYESVDYADEWFAERDAAFGLKVAA